MVATPYIFRDPSLTVNGTELKCHIRKISLVPEDSMADVETVCNPGGEAPSTTTWVAEIEALQSFGPEGAEPGFWDTMLPLAKTKADFVLKPRDTTVGPTNPSATFEAWVPSIPFMDSAIGESTVLTLEFKLIGEPIFATS